MRLPFRHGIVKYDVDNNKVPTFLEADPRERYVTLRADISAVLINLAFYDANYLFEENRAVNNAWGPFQSDIKYWLYWDIDKLTGARTFGSTSYEPLVSNRKPTVASVGQHWFDTNEMCMKVWSGKNWTPYIRLFACTYLNGFVNVYPLSTQVSVYESCDAGNILFDDLNSPTQQTTVDDTYKFLTDIVPFSDSKSVTTTVSLNQNIRYGIAGENITKYSLVSFKYDGTIQTASYSDPNKSAVVGIVDRDVAKGEKCYYKSTMYLSDYIKSWDADPSSPLYLGLFGYINQRPPITGYIQKVGTVISPSLAYIDISFHNIHYESFQKQPKQLTVDILSGKFYIKRDGVLPASTDIFIDETIIIEGGTSPTSPTSPTNPTTPTIPTTPTPDPDLPDPYAVNNILLLKFEEPQGGQAFTDSSNRNQIVTIVGNPYVSTAKSKIGTGSLYLDGTSSYLYYPNVFSSITSTTTPFSIDFWYYPTSLSVNTGAYVLGINSASQGRNVLIVGKGYWIDHNTVDPALPIQQNAWNHVALVSDGTNIVLYINGISTNTSPSPTTPLSDCVLGIGAEFDTANGGTPGNWAPGFVDKFRITAGVVRYTGDFDPNTEQAIPSGGTGGSGGSTGGLSGGGGTVGTPSNPVVPIPDYTGSAYQNVQAFVYSFTAKSFYWNITHDHRLPNFVVQAYDNNNELLRPVKLKATSKSNIQISFDRPVAGTATLFIY